mmetsp:Transcript_16782/g.42851  ORF Transcript_16782/g.42851 Transcript_16782/m.42851 type:complete len:402 (+) Transcript_16782:87-1292(+)
MVSGADARAIASNVFLFGLILGMAGTIELRSFARRVREYRGLAMGIASQFLLLPFLGFLVVRAFNLDPVAGITLLITTTSPGGGFSGLLCSLCNADLALSVAMTTVSTVVSMFLIPFNCILYIRSVYGVSVQLPWLSLLTSVGVVMAAVALGLFLSAKRPTWSVSLNRIGTFCGGANIILAGMSSGASNTPFWSHPPIFVMAIGTPCVVGLIISFLISRYMLGISGPQAVAICIECSYQNTALAITVALSVFKDDAGYAAGIPLIYGVIEPLVIGPFCLLAWKLGWTYAPREVGFWQWIGGNYQPSADDEPVVGNNAPTTTAGSEIQLNQHGYRQTHDSNLAPTSGRDSEVAANGRAPASAPYANLSVPGSPVRKAPRFPSRSPSKSPTVSATRTNSKVMH